MCLTGVEMEETYIDMSWHHFRKLVTPSLIILIVVHCPEIMEIGVFKYGMGVLVTVRPMCQIPPHCLWSIYGGFWIGRVQWDNIDNTCRCLRLQLWLCLSFLHGSSCCLLIFNSLVHDWR